MAWPLVAGMIGSAVVGAAGGIMGSRSAADAQEAAANRKAESDLAMFRESRGSTGSAVLPEYMRPWESSLATDAANTAQAVMQWGGGAKGRLSAAERTLSRYQPAFDAGDSFLGDLSSGKVAGDRRASLAPVLAARTNLAKTKSAAITSGLDSTLAKLRASRTNSGFRGLSTFDLNRSQAATMGAREQAAAAMQQSKLDNAFAMQGLDESNLQMRLGSMDLPYQMAQQRINLDNLPASSLAQFYGNAMAPLSFFRLPTANPPYQPANPSASTGQFAGAAMAGMGQQLGQYFAQQQLMQQMRAMYGQQAAPMPMQMPAASSLQFGSSYGATPTTLTPANGAGGWFGP